MKKQSFRNIFVFAALFFLFMAVTSVIDITHDRADDLSAQHFYMEVVTLLFSLLGASFFIYSTLQVTKRNMELAAEVKKATTENAEFKKKVAHFAQGLSSVIDDEFGKWGLTPSEKQIGFLILKGFSTKKIAEILGVTDKTTRHHCSSIYKKSDLSGRSELSAYFLEDLLVNPTPPDNEESTASPV